MDFKQTTQNGIAPPSDWKTKDSDFGLIVSNTVTVYGQTLVLKALSNAPIYKTEPVTFYSHWYNGSTTTTVTLGTSTFVDNINAVLIATLNSGTNAVYAEWPGEGRYAPKTTEGVPIQVVVNQGAKIGGNFYLRASPASFGAVAFEDSITFTAEFTTGISIPGNIRFYDNGVPIDSVVIVGNQASVTVPYLTAGYHLIQASWPGQVINSTVYQGVIASLRYTVNIGTPVNGPLTLTTDHAYGILQEGNIVLSANLTYTYNHLPGKVTFYKNNVAIGSSTMTNNTAVLSITNNYPIGSYAFKAIWDGNQGAIPAYTPVTSNTATFSVIARETIPSISLTVSPEPSVARLQDAILVATINTSSTVVGNINFYSSIDYSIGSASIINNVATLHTYDLTTGTHLLRAVYDGSAIAPKFYAKSSDYVSHVSTSGFILPYTINISSNRNPVSILSTVTYTVSNSGGIPLGGTASLNEVFDGTTQTAVLTSFTITNYQTFYDTIGDPGSWFDWRCTAPGWRTWNENSNPPYWRGSYPYTAPSTHWIEYYNDNGFDLGSQVAIYLGDVVGFFDVYGNYDTVNQGGFRRKGVFLNYAGGIDVFWKLTEYGLTVPDYQNKANHPYPDSRSFNPGQAQNWWLWWESHGGTETGSTLTEVTKELALGTAPGLGARPDLKLGMLASRTSTITSFWEVIKKQISTASWTSNTINFTINSNELDQTTSTHQIRAIWNGGLVNSIPYLAAESNTLTQVTNIPTLSISSAANPNTIVNANTFTATISGDPVNNKSVQFKDGTSTIATIITNGNVATLTLPSSVLTSGTHYISAKLVDIDVVSNTITQTIVIPKSPIMTLAMSTSTFTYYNKAGTINTAITATTKLVSVLSGRAPTSVVKLYDVRTNSLIGTGSLNPSGTTSTASITFNPATFGFLPSVGISSKINNLRMEYEGDVWNTSASSTSSFIAITKYPLTFSLNEVTVDSGVYNPSSVVATFEAGSNPTGTVVFKEGTTTLDTVNVSGGIATLSSRLYSLGVHNITATYSGATAYTGSSNTVGLLKTAQTVVFGNFSINDQGNVGTSTTQKTLTFGFNMFNWVTAMPNHNVTVFLDIRYGAINGPYTNVSKQLTVSLDSLVGDVVQFTTTYAPILSNGKKYAGVHAVFRYTGATNVTAPHDADVVGYIPDSGYTSWSGGALVLNIHLN